MRSFIRIVALAVALVIPGSAFAQQYPSKPVKIIVPFPPAGVTDIVGRLVAQKLSEKLGEQFYIENIAGAGGNLGMGQAARSPGPFAGGGPMVQSLLGGHTPIACSAIGNAMALIKDRKIRVLAITANKRVEFAPEIPTLADLGIENQEAETMTGVFVPAGTPKPIVDLLQN